MCLYTNINTIHAAITAMVSWDGTGNEKKIFKAFGIGVVELLCLFSLIYLPEVRYTPVDLAKFTSVRQTLNRPSSIRKKKCRTHKKVLSHYSEHNSIFHVPNVIEQFRS